MLCSIKLHKKQPQVIIKKKKNALKINKTHTKKQTKLKNTNCCYYYLIGFFSKKHYFKRFLAYTLNGLLDFMADDFKVSILKCGFHS